MCRHVSAYSWWFDATWPSQGMPRGTFILVVVIKIFWSPWGSTPGPPPPCKAFTTSARPLHRHLFLVIYVCIIVFKFTYICIWREVGSGLGPGPWFCFKTYDHSIIFMHAVVTVGARCFKHSPWSFSFIPCDPNWSAGGV
jgi:hypothetical protein